MRGRRADGRAVRVVRRRLLRAQERRAHLHAGRAERQCGRDPAPIGDPAGGDHGHRHRVDDLRNQRDRADERLLGSPQERHPMPTGLEPGGHDRVHAALLELDRLVDRGRRAHRRMRALAHSRPRPRAARRTRSSPGRPRRQDGVPLLLERREEGGGRLLRRGQSDLVEEGTEGVDGCLVVAGCERGIRRGIRQRQPHVEIERPARRGADRRHRLGDAAGVVRVEPERPEPAELAHRGRELDRRQPAERPEHDRVVDAEHRGELGRAIGHVSPPVEPTRLPASR